MRSHSSRGMLTRTFVGACVALTCGVARAGAADAPVATEMYRRALAVMNDLQEPPFVTARLEGTGEGLRADLTRAGGCDHVRLSFGNDRADWIVLHRTREPATAIVDQRDGARYLSGAVDPASGHAYLSGYDPTWLSTYQALRAPLLVPQTRCAPPPQTPAPQRTEPLSSGHDLTVIGTVAAIGPGIYHVEDAGSAMCPNGNPGHALHLWSRTRNPRQTLSGVVIETPSMRFCTVRFRMRRGAGLGIDSVIEQHFAEVGGYWIQTDGFVEATARVAGIASGHGVWRYRYLDVTYPPSIPSEAFNTPHSAPGRP